MDESALVRSRERRGLFFVLLLALALRLPRLFFMPIVEGDGAEYCRIAENLASGQGYVGLLEGPELMLPPLYPWSIAGLKSILPQVATPYLGRAVSMLAGLATVLILYFLAKRQSGPRVAWWTACAVATLPAFVFSSTAVFAESLQLAFLAAAFSFFDGALAKRKITTGLISGVFFGLSYLVRVEGLALSLLSALLLVLARPASGPNLRHRMLPAAALILGFLAVASPYVSFLHANTGSYRFEGKAERVFSAIDRYAQGEPYFSANYAIDSRGEELGPWLSPNVPRRSPGLWDVVSKQPARFFEHYASNLKRIAWLLLSGASVSSVLIILASFLALRHGAASHRGWVFDVLLVSSVLYGIGVTGLYKVVLRYLFLLALPIALWVGRFLAQVQARSETQASRLGARTTSILLALLLILPLYRGLITGLSEFDEASASHGPVSTVGSWLSTRVQSDTVIASDDPRVAYYAGARWLPMPVAPTKESLLLYLAARNVRFAALKEPPPGAPAHPSRILIPDEGLPPKLMQEPAPAGFRVFSIH